jgi:hypothetical protein
MVVSPLRGDVFILGALRPQAPAKSASPTMYNEQWVMYNEPLRVDTY